MSGITNPSEKYFKDGQWTFDGSVWRPQSQLIAYRDTLREYQIKTNPTAGTNYFVGTTIPAGEARVINTIMAYNATTAACNIGFGVYTGGVYYYIKHSVYAALTRYLDWVGELVLNASDLLFIVFNSCQANDGLYGYWQGYKFKVAE